MNIVVKIRCTCGTWVRIRSTKLPTDEVQCWKCASWIKLTFVRHTGGTAVITKGGIETRTTNVDVEALELP